MSTSGTSSAWSEKDLTGGGLKLVELLVVIVILGILIVVATIGLNNRAKTNTCKAEVSTVESAYVAYVTQNGGATPANLATLQGVMNSNLKKSMKYVRDISSAGAISMKSDAPCRRATN